VNGFPGSVIITGTPVTTSPNPAPGTKATATATCPAGSSLLGGGGWATANALALTAIYRSYPSASNTWTVSGVVNVHLGGGASMVVQAYAVCTAPVS